MKQAEVMIDTMRFVSHLHQSNSKMQEIACESDITKLSWFTTNITEMFRFRKSLVWKVHIHWATMNMNTNVSFNLLPTTQWV